MTATVDTYAPATLEAAVLELLREAAPMLLTRRALAQLMRRRHAPSSSLAEVQALVADTLTDLLHAGRVERVESRSAVPGWTAAYSNDDIERRVLRLRDQLGGRPVEVVAGGDPANPTVTITAPLSLVECLAP